MKDCKRNDCCHWNDCKEESLKPSRFCLWYTNLDKLFDRIDVTRIQELNFIYCNLIL